MAELFQYLVVFLLAVWTARMAITKGRNPWAWGGAALILGLFPWHLFGVLPVLVLLFFKLPSDAAAAPPPERLACPRCAKTHTEGQHFCTGCGWDLNEAYSPEGPDEGQPFPSKPQVQATVQSTSVAPPTQTTDAPAAETPVAEEAAIVEAETSGPVEPVVAGSAEESVAEVAEQQEPAEEEPVKEHVPWGTYAVGVAPTAALMVSRGIKRLDEGKFQEAIDQFTKAIALDPNYAEAWERRSEAYAQLGRSKLAEEDRRHLQGLDPSSFPG